MLETPHVAVAAAIAYKIPDPTISLPLVFVSHFVFDMYPHWNPLIHKEKKLYGYRWDGSWYDIGTFQRWEDAIKKWKKK